MVAAPVASRTLATRSTTIGGADRHEGGGTEGEEGDGASPRAPGAGADRGARRDRAEAKRVAAARKLTSSLAKMEPGCPLTVRGLMKLLGYPGVGRALCHELGHLGRPVAEPCRVGRYRPGGGRRAGCQGWRPGEDRAAGRQRRPVKGSMFSRFVRLLLERRGSVGIEYALFHPGRWFASEAHAGPNARTSAKASMSAPEERWIHTLAVGVISFRKTEASAPSIGHQTHDAPTTPAANRTRPSAACEEIAPPRTPTVSSMACGLSTETPTAWTTVVVALGLRVGCPRLEREQAHHDKVGATRGDQEIVVTQHGEKRRGAHRS